MSNKTINDNFDVELKCVSCGSILKLTYLDETRRILMCTNKECLFPIDAEDMNQFIYEQGNVKDFLLNALKVLNQLNSEEETNEYENINYNNINNNTNNINKFQLENDNLESEFFGDSIDL